MDKAGTGELRVVVVGGSAGAIDALRRIVGKLSADFPAAIFITTHVPRDSVSALPHILSRSGPMFATHAIDGAPIAPGRIFVAPPDHHLFLQDGVMRVLRGPSENSHRPSIDVLFRSAATAFRERACAVLVSGTLDDGVAGLVNVHDAGGTTLVQDPEDAHFADMPLNALETGVVDGVHTADALPDAICAWIEAPVKEKRGATLPADEREAGVPSVYTCPDCSGTLWELDNASTLRFRCRTGHAYTAHSMLSAHEEHLEDALWASVRALEERRDLLRRMTLRARQNGYNATSHNLDQRAVEVERDLDRVRSAIDGLLASSANRA